MASSDVDVVITEVGGTVGDIESLPFLEAIRQFRNEAGRDNVCYLHVTLVPFIGPSGEQKTKPTQHSVTELRSRGIQPDIIVCRSEEPLSSGLKRKISHMCDVDTNAVINAADVMPIVQSGITKQLTKTLLFTSPTLVTPALGTVASGVISACTSTGMVMVAPVIGAATGTSLAVTGAVTSSGTAGVGYAAGAGGAVTQATSRTTGVTLNKTSGAITLFSAAGTTVATTFTVTNSTVAATDVIILNQKSGTDLYDLMVTAVGAGSFNITFRTTGGTTTEQPVFNFAVIKGVAT